MIQSMDVQLGTFHDVEGVAVGVDCVSILDQSGVEQLIHIKPVFNPYRHDFDPVEVQGEFGDFSDVQGGYHLQGLEPTSITKVEVVVDFEEDDFHTRVLRLKSASGLNLTWELFCNGNPTKN